MSSYAFLIGRPDKKPLFSNPDGANEIAHANDWIPLGWLALFESRDVQLVEEPPDSDTYDPDTVTRCPTLIRKRDAALEILKKRRARLAKILPPHLQPQLDGLEAAVRASPLPYLQAVVSDLDMFVSFPGSERNLRALVSTLDSEDTKQWRGLLSHVDTDMGKDLSKVEFSELTGVAAVVGNLPAQFAVSRAVKPPASKKGAPAKKTVAGAAKPKKPWWKFW